MSQKKEETKQIDTGAKKPEDDKKKDDVLKDDKG